MKVIVFKNENEYGEEYKAVLSDGHRPKLTNFYSKISDVYDFANWASERYDTVVDVEFRR